ncbi:MAG: MmcQ/YjbR family DNA-binding protein [Pseudomonadota bacterium]
MSVSAAQARAIVAALPNALDETTAERLVFSVGGRGFAWTFMARPIPKKPRAPDIKVLAVRCSLDRKAMLIEAAPEIYFDDAHYRGYPAVLVRLPVIGVKEFRALLAAAFELEAHKPPKKPKKPAKKKVAKRRS